MPLAVSLIVTAAVAGLFFILFHFWQEILASHFMHELGRIWHELVARLGPLVFAAGGVIARLWSRHGQWVASKGKEGEKMTAALTLSHLFSVPLWGLSAAGVVDWWLHGPEYVAWAIAAWAGFLGPTLSDILIDGVRRLIAALTDRVRGGPADGGPTGGGV
jgi:hypothetical protein